MSRGSLPQAIRASMAVPGLFAPVKIDGRTLIDGGAVSNLPIDIARQMGADIVIAVDIGTQLKPADQITSMAGVTSQMIRATDNGNDDVNYETTALSSGSTTQTVGTIGLKIDQLDDPVFPRHGFYLDTNAQASLSQDDGSYNIGVFAGASLEAGNVWNMPQRFARAPWLTSASVFVGSTTVIGPVYLGFAMAPGGTYNIDFQLGNRF